MLILRIEELREHLAVVNVGRSYFISTDETMINIDANTFLVSVPVLRTPAGLVAPPSMAAPPATKATRNRSTPAAASTRCLAGSNSGAAAPVQAARHRQGECGVWPVRDRL